VSNWKQALTTRARNARSALAPRLQRSGAKLRELLTGGRKHLVGLTIRTWKHLVGLTIRTWKHLVGLTIRTWKQLVGMTLGTRERLVRITLGTRLFLVLVSMAAATSLTIVMLQDRSLSGDLQRAAEARLQSTSGVASQLLDEHLAAQFERYRTVSTTPQFIANFESHHGPTLSHYAKGLAEQNEARVILFTNGEGEEVAGCGDEELRILVREHLESVSPSKVDTGREKATTSLVALRGVPYSMVNIPVQDDAQLVGGLVALEAISLAELSSWSRLCGARVTVDDGAVSDQLTSAFRSVGDLQFRVTISYDSERAALANSRTNAIVGGLAGLALATLASLLLARSLVRPILAIQAATERIAGGDLQFRLDSGRSDEVGDVARGFNLMLERLDQNIRERIRIENQISHLAYHDSLTGLGNRRLFKERFETAIEESRSGGSGLSVIFLDLDRFKDVNDTLGHTAGDELLIEVAKRIDGCLTAMGVAGEQGEQGEGRGFLARLGGDEFTVLLSGVEDHQEIEVLAKRILRALAAPVNLREQEVRLSASMGIALAPDDADDAETLLRYSDMAMFHAKNRGGRGYEFYSDSMQEIASNRLALERKIQRALENEEFELYYQPKLDLATGQVKSAEALLRWRDPVLGLVGPAEFIPMAEETGAIVPIGEWVLREAVEQAVRWQAEGVPPVRIAVNVSARQLECGDDFAAKIADLLEETGLDPSLLDLEITESAMLKDEDAVIALLENLRDQGVGLALDDFGTGYSSLSYLRRLPINTLKIDRSFIMGVETNAEEAALVESIISMAKTLNLRVVAEGVETRKQQRFLDDLGCDEIQGFLFSRPIDATDAAEFLSRKRRKRARKKATKKATRRSNKSAA